MPQMRWGEIIIFKMFTAIKLISFCFEVSIIPLLFGTLMPKDIWKSISRVAGRTAYLDCIKTQVGMTKAENTSGFECMKE